MTRLFKILIICLLTVNLHGQNANRLQLDSIKGGIKKCDVYFYIYENGDTNKYSKRLESQFKYNNDGYLIEETSYGSLYYKITYKCNKKGKQTENIWYKEDGTMNYRNTYKYDKKGNMIKDVGYYGKWQNDAGRYNYDGSKSWVYKYKYNENGKHTKSVVRGEGSTTINKIKFHDKKIIEDIKYNKKNHQVFEKTNYTYDDKGNLIEKKSLYTKTCYQYDNNGNQIIATEYENGHIQSQYSQKFDSSKRLIEGIWVMYFNGDSTISKNSFKYDTSGNVIEDVRIYNTKESVATKHIYEYDNRGMLTKDTEYKNDSIDNILSYKYDVNKNKTEHLFEKPDGSDGCRVTMKYDKWGNELEEIRFDKLNVPQSKKEFIYSN